jgi:hypothetical protein
MNMKTLLFAALAFAMCFSAARAQDCETALEDALESYDLRKYDEVIARLTKCVPQLMLEKSQKINAYELLALSYAAVNAPDSASLAMNDLLDLYHDYYPMGPSYTREYVEMVAKVKKKRHWDAPGRRSSIIRNKWFWLGGIAASSAAAIMIIQREKDTGLLPEPPDPPKIP